VRVPRRALTASAIVLCPFVYDWMNTYERHIHESSPPIADVCHVTRQLLDKIDDIDNHQDNQNHHQVLQVIATQGALFGSTRYPEFLSRYSFPVYRFLFRFSCFRLRRRRLNYPQCLTALYTTPHVPTLPWRPSIPHRTQEGPRGYPSRPAALRPSPTTPVGGTGCEH